ncbi:MAG: hypothetical protein IPN29_20500 [Saprospiraceae bacterium]|nr:hypothetical protein [Saprospiraceae bacterium]
MKRTIVLLIILTLFNRVIYSQFLSPESVCSYGRSVTAAAIMLEDNLGSLMVSNIHTPTFLYTQGFIQPDAGTTNIVPLINDVFLEGGYFVTDAMGTTLKNNGDDAMLEFSLGEVLSRTQAASSFMLTQGVLQPFLGKHWLGIINTDWKNQFNWSPSFEPSSSDHVIIPPFCPNYPIITQGKTGNCKTLLLMDNSSLQIKNGGALLMAN